MKLTVFILIILLVYIIYLFYRFVYDGTVFFTSQVDNRDYRVRRGSNQQLHANILATINKKLNVIINSLKKENTTSEGVARLLKNWNGVTIKEIGHMETDAAYVVNKKYMSFCIQTTKPEYNISDVNLITYVAIHEMAHIMSQEIGHGTEFVNNFEFLLNYSKKLK